MLIIGIDPGISGSICFFEDGKIVDLVEMPSMAEGKKNKKQVNAAQILMKFILELKIWKKKISKLLLNKYLQCQVKAKQVGLISVNHSEF